MADSATGVASQPPRTVRTLSGSEYRIEGRTVRKLNGEQPAPAFELVDIRRNRLRYTDGSQLFISTPLVAA
ncbi:MAG TPA: hypothetical protein VMM13_19815 [Euzebya sp.]|nr:hypothetical protein [Euzebya sp.]